MAELKINDFDEMLTTSTKIGNEFGLDSENIMVQIVDEDGEVYDIQDVKFNLQTRSILIEFNHDNED